MQAQRAARVESDRSMTSAGLTTSPVRGAGRPWPALTAAGWPAILAVAAGGATLGFFAWYALISRGPRGGAFLELTFLALMAGGIAGTLWLWHAYAVYFARRTDLSYATALRWDSLSWALLVVMWLAMVASLGPSTTGRAVALAIGLWGLTKLLVAARFNRTVRDVLITFVTTRAPIIVIAELAAVVVGQRPGLHYAASTSHALAVWGRWDAEHYIGIATNGYSGTEPAFFPLYPLLIRILAVFTGNHLIAGLLISNVASFFGLLFFYKLVEHQYSRAVAQRATFYVSIFPTAIFFSAVYTESLFFALTVASFYYIRERHWVTAGIIGFFAALTRVEGVLLALPFFIEWITVLGENRREIIKWPRDYLARPLIGLALIPAGLASYMAYLWVLRGDPLYFSHVQIHWGRHFAAPWVSLLNAIGLMAHAHNPLTIVNQGLELAFTVLMLAVLVAGIRRLRPSYWVYMAASILVPMSTSSLMSMPRFALVLFPMFVVFGLWGARQSTNNAIVAFSLPLLGLFTVLFADWYWVA
jgi:hypothetical protein